MTGLNHERRESVEALDDLGQLTQNGLKFFNPCVNRRGFFKCKAGGCGFALRRKFADQGISGGIKVGLHPLNFRGIFLVAAAFETGARHIFISE